MLLCLIAGKNLICSPEQPGSDIPHLCRKLRGISDDAPPKPKTSKSRKVIEDQTNPPSWANVPKEAYELLSGLMNLNPKERLSAKEALKHDFFTLKLWTKNCRGKDFGHYHWEVLIPRHFPKWRIPNIGTLDWAASCTNSDSCLSLLDVTRLDVLTWPP